jgi:hypothetical protein
MPPKSKVITQLSPEQRVELSRQIIAHGFIGFKSIAESWQEKGIDISEYIIRRWADELRAALVKGKVKDPNITLVLKALNLG